MTDEKWFALLNRTMREARRNKRYGRDCSDFERSWAPLLMRMLSRLQDKTFRVDQNYAFLTSVPQWREIFTTFFEGRNADHLLCDSLAPYTEQELHPRTFNNSPGKGGQAAINQVLEDIYEVSCGYMEPCRIIKWDLKCCFPNANNDVIESCFVSLIEKNRRALAGEYDPEFPDFLKWLAMVCVHAYPARHCELRTPAFLWQEHISPDKSLFGKPDGIGAPIGRFPSQIGMSLYLNPEVRWLNEECGIRATLFMDDCVEVIPERLHGYALALMPELRRRLAAKGLRLNEKKFYDQPYQHGCEFLGCHIQLHRSHINNKTFIRAVERIQEFNEMQDKLRYIDNVLSSINSYTGLMKGHADYGRIQQLRSKLAADWWEMFDWDESRLCVTYKPEFSINARLIRKYHLKLKKHDKTRNPRTKEHRSESHVRRGGAPRLH